MRAGIRAGGGIKRRGERERDTRVHAILVNRDAPRERDYGRERMRAWIRAGTRAGGGIGRRGERKREAWVQPTLLNRTAPS